MGELTTAMTDCERSLALLPNNHNTLEYRALVHLKASRFQDAISDYDRTLALNYPVNRAPSLFGRGVAKRRLGNVADGDADILAAQRLQPDIAEEYARYGVRP